MKRAETWVALGAWMDARQRSSDLSTALTSSVRMAGATALVLMRWSEGANGEVLGLSAGAPIELVNLCRDLGAGTTRLAAQERRVAGIGTIAWTPLPFGKQKLVLFGLFSGAADLSAMEELSLVCARCVDPNV